MKKLLLASIICASAQATILPDKLIYPDELIFEYRVVGGNRVVYDFDEPLAGDPPAQLSPWANMDIRPIAQIGQPNAKLYEVTLNSTLMGGSHLSEWLFYTPSTFIGNVVITGTTGDFAPPTISYNLPNPDGPDGIIFDYGLSFDQCGSARFDEDDSITIQYLSTGYRPVFWTVAHVHNSVCACQSGWVGTQPGGVVPEPRTYALLAGLGLLGFASYRKFKT